MENNEKALELETRRRIYNAIKGIPGMHFREICRNLNMSPSVVEYHLRYLTSRELVVARKDGRYTRYYPYGDIDAKDKPIIGIMRNPMLRNIVMHILLHPGCSHKDLLGVVDVGASTLSFHLSKLENMGIIYKKKSGRKHEYYIKNENKIADILITYKETFSDALVDDFVSLWQELHP